MLPGGDRVAAGAGKRAPGSQGHTGRVLVFIMAALGGIFVSYMASGKDRCLRTHAVLLCCCCSWCCVRSLFLLSSMFGCQLSVFFLLFYVNLSNLFVVLLLPSSGVAAQTATRSSTESFVLIFLHSSSSCFRSLVVAVCISVAAQTATQSSKLEAESVRKP